MNVVDHKETSNIESRIQVLLSILEESPAMATFVAPTVERLKDLAQRIKTHQTHIAIIGITSCGKSTLMNTILGKKLLPTRVAPTSGKQVICGYAPHYHARIIFEPESGKKSRDLTSNIENELKRYGDEQYNPRNKEQVSEIQVFSPDFKFNRDLIFVDTPGLDAHNLGEHERITLQLVLPTVDMVMYLTTVKAEQDGVNLAMLEQVMSKSKPLVVVQNKIDSIEPKISSRGKGPDKIEKTKDEVREELLVRLQKLLGNATKDSVRNAPIVQISANALDWKQSNLETLNNVLNEQIARNAHYRDNFYSQQLKETLDDLINSLRSRIEGSVEARKLQEEREAKLRNYQSHRSDLSSSIKQIENDLIQECKRIEALKNNLLKALEDRYATPRILSAISGFFGQESKYNNPQALDQDIKQKKESFAGSLKSISSRFSNCISDIYAKFQTCCDDYGLDSTRLLQRPLFSSFATSISDCSEEKTIHHAAKRVKQEGFWGGAKRFFTFGHCGYDDIPAWDETITECNIEKLINTIKGAYQKEMAFVQEKLGSFQQSLTRAVPNIDHAFSLRKTEYSSQDSNDFPLEEGKSLLAKLQKGNDIPQEAIPAKVVNVETPQTPPAIIEKLEHVQYEERVIQTFNLANAWCLEANRGIMRKLVERSGLRKTIVAGWSQERLDAFKEIFLGDERKVELLDLSLHHSLPSASGILLILLVNAEQIGSTEKKIFDNAQTKRFLQEAAENGKIIWTMDSVRAHVFQDDERDTLIETFLEMLRTAKKILGNRPVFDVMACERELYYTFLFHELLNWRGTTQNEKQKFVEEFTKVFHLDVERREKTGKYLNQYIEEKKN